MSRNTFAIALAASALSMCAFATDYYWIGGESGEWASGSNWSLSEGGDAAEAYPNGVDKDSAVFDASAAFTMSTGINVSNITIAANCRVQFASSTSYQALQVANVIGESTSVLALSNARLVAGIDNAAIGGQVEIVEGTQNGIYGNSGKGLVVNANIIGSGELYFRNNATKGSRGGVSLYGDNSGFSGTAHILMAQGSDMMGTTGYATSFKWMTLESGSASARWIIEGADGTNGPKFPEATLTSEANPFKLGTLEGSKNIAGGINSVFYLQVGGANDFEYTGTISRGSSSNGTKLIKVGTGTMTFGGTLESKNSVSSITIKEGSFKFGASGSIPDGGIIMAGGVLKAAEEDGVKIDPSAKISTASTAAIIYDDEGDDTTWAKIGAVTTGLTKRGSGTLTVQAASYTGETKVEAGRLVLPAGMTVSKLEVADGATIGVYTTESYSEPTAVLTISEVAEGTDISKVIPNTATTAFTFETDSETGVVTVKATRAALVFTWTGAEDTAWENPANWLVNNAAVTEVPTAVDTALFPAKAEGVWTVSVASDTHISAMTNNAPVTLSGEGDIYLGSVGSELEEAPVLTLGDDATIRSENVDGGTLKVDVPVCITASADHPAQIGGRWMKSSGGSSSLYLNQALTGTGSVMVFCSRGGIYFNGDNSEFAGTLEVKDDSSSSVSGGLRTAPEFVNANSTSAKAVWTINNGASSTLKGSGTTYCFGALNGSIQLNTTQSNYQNNTLEIGARDDVDSTLEGNFFANSYINLVNNRGNTIRKVGNSTLTTKAIHVKAYELNGGLTVLDHDRAVHTRWNGEKTEVTEETAEAESCYNIPITFGGGALALGDDVTADPSANIVNSQSAIVFSNATDRTFATALAASNVGGFTKKGAGTLTLSAAPLYTGATKVEDGKLVVNGAINLEDGSAMYIDDLSVLDDEANYPVFLEATSITGKATLAWNGAEPLDEAGAKKLAKFKVQKMSTSDGQCLTIGSAVGFYIRLR